MNDLTLKLSVTVEQANLILGALSKLSYEAVAGLIGVITGQAQEQIQSHSEYQNRPKESLPAETSPATEG
jgi:hypothetical protein